MPDGYLVPEERVKPWGTAHAVLCAKDKVNEPFTIINSDDFYGLDAYEKASEFIKKNNGSLLSTFVHSSTKSEMLLSNCHTSPDVPLP